MSSFHRKTLGNEKGMMSLLIAFGVVSVAALVILQLSTVFISAHKLRARRQHLEAIKSSMQALLGQKIKRAWVLARLDPTCSHGVGFSPVTIDGHTLCINSSQGLCVNVGKGTDQKTYCASSNPTHLDWTHYGSAPTASPITALPSATLPTMQAGEKRVNITVPDTSTYHWRRCNTPADACFRLVMCPEGETSCDLNTAIGVQVVRLGALPTGP
jgi:type II secretory pathway pseudopilin PulG